MCVCAPVGSTHHILAVANSHYLCYTVLSSWVHLNNNFLQEKKLTALSHCCQHWAECVRHAVTLLSKCSKLCDPSFRQTLKGGKRSCAVSETCWKIKTDTWNNILRCWCHSSADRKRCFGTSLICHIYRKWHLRHRRHIKAGGKINKTTDLYIFICHLLVK